MGPLQNENLVTMPSQTTAQNAVYQNVSQSGKFHQSKILIFLQNLINVMCNLQVRISYLLP